MPDYQAVSKLIIFAQILRFHQDLSQIHRPLVCYVNKRLTDK